MPKERVNEVMIIGESLHNIVADFVDQKRTTLDMQKKPGVGRTDHHRGLQPQNRLWADTERRFQCTSVHITHRMTLPCSPNWSHARSMPVRFEHHGRPGFY